VKQDGFRLIVSRDGDKVRLLTRNGYDWTSRYPLIVEAARRIRTKQFVLDGEAVLLGVDGISDFDGLYTSTTTRSNSTPSTSCPLTGTISESFRCTCEKPISPACWRVVLTESIWHPLSKVRSDRTCFAPPAT
jgi:ATP dependent DNA ligase domain